VYHRIGTCFSKTTSECQNHPQIERQSFLDLYKPCIIQILNFHSIDLQWLNLPAVLEKYLIRCTPTMYDYKVAIHFNSTGKRESYTPPSFPSKLAFRNWQRTIHTDLFPPRGEKYYFDKVIGKRLVIPEIDKFYEAWPTGLNFDEADKNHTSTETFLLLLISRIDEKNLPWTNYWSHGIQIKSSVGFQRIVMTLNYWSEFPQMFLFCQFFDL